MRRCAVPPSRIVVSDASVIIDLAKTRLIEATLALPFEFVIPDAIFDAELISLANYTPADLVRLGFTVGTLDGPDVASALTLYGRNPALSFNDCLALTYAQVKSCILMTGDGPLRLLAQKSSVEVHGLLWAARLMSEHKTCPNSRIMAALEALRLQPSARLPAAALAELIAALKISK